MQLLRAWAWQCEALPCALHGAHACTCMQVHHVTVRGGPNGYSDFIRDIQHIFGITAEHDMQLAFDCADPITGAARPLVCTQQALLSEHNIFLPSTSQSSPSRHAFDVTG